MYIENVEFIYDCPISFEAWETGSYHLHCHRDVIEVLMVLSGKARVKVSFEEFQLDEGDYVVIRESDSHAFSAIGSSCRLVSLYFRMEDYKKQIPYLAYIYFACESFDLARYRNETSRLREMISSVIYNLAKNQPVCLEEAKKGAENLLWVLVSDYDMITYYNRNWDVPFSKIEKYYRIMSYIMENSDMKNLQEYISSQEHYSKSYIMHLFKEVGGSSFRDVHDYTRLFRSEKMLLDSDMPVSDISEMCGFSDIKYYIKNFKKWFLTTPAEYRKKYLPEVNKKSVFKHLDSSQLLPLLENMLKGESKDPLYKAAITPLSVKIFGGGHSPALMGEGNIASDKINENMKAGSGSHSILFSIDEKILSVNKMGLFMQLKSLSNSGFSPVLVIDKREMSASRCRKVITECLKYFSGSQADIPEIFILYNDFGEYDHINELVSIVENEYSHAKLRPFMIP